MNAAILLFSIELRLALTVDPVLVETSVEDELAGEEE
jgi:hypothetical protein